MSSSARTNDSSGDAGYVRERAAAWEETGVTTLLLSCRSADEVRQVAETVA